MSESNIHVIPLSEAGPHDVSRGPRWGGTYAMDRPTYDAGQFEQEYGMIALEGHLINLRSLAETTGDSFDPAQASLVGRINVMEFGRMACLDGQDPGPRANLYSWGIDLAVTGLGTQPEQVRLGRYKIGMAHHDRDPEGNVEDTGLAEGDLLYRDVTQYGPNKGDMQAFTEFIELNPTQTELFSTPLERSASEAEVNEIRTTLDNLLAKPEGSVSWMGVLRCFELSTVVADNVEQYVQRFGKELGAVATFWELWPDRARKCL